MHTTSSLSNHKVVQSGPMIEVYEYEKGVRTGTKGQGGRRARSGPPKPQNIHQRRQTLNKARKTIQRLSFANFDTNDKFITLTYKGSPPSIQEANADFKHFIQKLQYRFGSFHYLSVLQFQDKHERGAVHYHLLTDLPYIATQDLAALWGQGFVKINCIRQVGNVGEYVASHLTADPFDSRLYQQRLFSTSRNLKKPLVLRGEEAKEIAEGLKTKKEVSAWSYQSEYFGQISYTEFNLNNI